MRDTRTNEPMISIWFGNFYRPAYDDSIFIKEEIQHLKQLGFNSIELDSKAWEDFRERFEGKEASQYVAQQEYMMEQCRENGISYHFLALYLCADNLYPNIRFSPPIFGESVTNADGTDGRWYKYWSEKAKESMLVHVRGLLENYKEGMTAVTIPDRGIDENSCLAQTLESKADQASLSLETARQIDISAEGALPGTIPLATSEKPAASPAHVVYPTCTMWDPIVAPSFDEEGRLRYLDWLSRQYGSIDKLNDAYQTRFRSFEELQKEDYWFACAYPDCGIYTKEELNSHSPKAILWADNMKWRIYELCDYFQDMQKRLHEIDPNLFTMPDMTQWGYFLNVDPSHFQVGLGDLWDTANRGIDIFKLSKYVDCCHFIAVPVTPDGDPNAYVVAAQHAMMRAMNAGREFMGGIFWGRYLYNNLYATLTPCEIVGSIVASGASGYASYGMCGMDDGGVLHRMDDAFLDSLGSANEWAKTVIPQIKERSQSPVAILFPSAMSAYEPFGVEGNAKRRYDFLGWYQMCCDYGFDCDIIDPGIIEEKGLDSYQALIIPENDCYYLDENKLIEETIREWVNGGGTLIHAPFDGIAANCFGLIGKTHTDGPIQYDEKILTQSDVCCSYESENAVHLASWLSDGSGAVVKNTFGSGAIYSFGFAYGYSYCAKDIPHVPLSEKNNEFYPVQLAKTNILEQILKERHIPQNPFHGKGIETARFDNCTVVINHTPHPVDLSPVSAPEKRFVYQYEIGRQILLPHAAVAVFDRE